MANMANHLLSLCLLTALWPVAIQGLPHQDPANPCAEVSKIVRQTGKTHGIPGSLARQCLLSIPFHHEESLQLGHELEKYLQFQSTLDELRDPPTGYLSGPVKLDETLSHVIRAAKHRTYASQAEFDEALTKTFNTARDGQLHVQPCSLGIFDFYQDLALVSVSADGLQMPKTYTRGDMMLLDSTKHAVSSVASINGKDVAVYINEIPGFHDPDARYNRLFANPAQTVSRPWSRNNFAYNNGQWSGADLVIKYANGTTQNVSTLASLGPAFERFSGMTEPEHVNFTDGTKLFEELCLSSAPTATTTSVRAYKRSMPAQVPFKQASAQDEQQEKTDEADKNTVPHDFAPASFDSDLAVLSVPSFGLPSSSASSTEAQVKDHKRHFLAAAKTVLDQAREAGKNKLVIDLSGNLGGQTSLAHGLYRLLFPRPDEQVFSATRFRKHVAVALVGKAISNSHTSRKTCADEPLAALCASATVEPNRTTDFDSWESLYGEDRYFSAVHAVADSSPAAPDTARLPPFAPQNIILVTDGLCSSACAEFAALLRNHAEPAHRVRSIALGGRPKLGPMQVVGGSKGAQALSFAAIDALVAEARAALHANTAGLTIHEAQSLSAPDGKIPRGLSTLAMRILDGGVGFSAAYDVSSGVRSGKTTPTPRQFLYEAADCRLFYTRDMLLSPAAVWERVAWSAWGGVGGAMRDCVVGSTGAPGSVGAGGVKALEAMYMTTSVRDGPDV